MATSFLRNALRPEFVRVSMAAETKEEAIRELVGILEAGGVLPDPEEALRVVCEREKVMSTGMERGIAIPHGKTDTVDSLHVAFATKPEGIDFDSVDRREGVVAAGDLQAAAVLRSP